MKPNECNEKMRQSANFFQKMASAKKSDLNLLLRKYLIKSSLFSAPIFLFIYFFAIDIFMFVFGKNWRLAGEIASIMSPWLFFNFLSAPMANIFIILNKQEIVLLVSIFYMIIPLLILWLLNELGFIYVLNLITLFMSLILILYIGLIFIYTQKEKNRDL